MSKELTKEVVYAIEWLATEFKFLRIFHQALERIENEDAEQQEKELKKNRRFVRYIGKAERRVERRVQDILEELKKAKEIPINHQQLNNLIRTIEIPSKQLVKKGSLYVGKLITQLKIIRTDASISKKYPDENHKQQVRKEIQQLEVEISDLEKWVVALDVILKKIASDDKINQLIEDNYRIKKLGGLTDVQFMKIKLMAEGMQITVKAKAALTSEGKIPLSLVEYATTSGIPLQFVGTHIYVNAVFFESFAKESQIQLDFEEGKFFIKEEVQSFEVKPFPLPGYFSGKDSFGKRYSNYVMTHTDRARVSPIFGCAFSCNFCDLSRTRKYAKIPVDELVEGLNVAIVDNLLPAQHILISGGTAKEKDWSYMDETYEKICRKFSNYHVDIMMPPRPDLKYPKKLKLWGAEYLTVDIEIFSETIAAKIIPEKYGVGRAHYLRFMEAAVEVFGKNKVRSAIIIGLESLDKTLDGIKALAKIGVSPILSPFRPSIHTPMGKVSPPSVNLLAEAYLMSVQIVKKYGVKLGSDCIFCHHNTLTFPDGSNFYHYSKPEVKKKVGTIIRKGKTKDRSAILNILAEAFTTKSYQSFEREVDMGLSAGKTPDSQTDIYVCVDQESQEILGYISLRNWSRTYWWDTMAVAKDSRGLGIATKLTQFIKDKCVEDNVPQVNMWTYHRDLIPMYEKQGFIFAGEVDGIFPPFNEKRVFLRWRNPKFKEIVAKM